MNVVYKLPGFRAQNRDTLVALESVPQYQSGTVSTVSAFKISQSMNALLRRVN